MSQYVVFVRKLWNKKHILWHILILEGCPIWIFKFASHKQKLAQFCDLGAFVTIKWTHSHFCLWQRLTLEKCVPSGYIHFVITILSLNKVKCVRSTCQSGLTIDMSYSTTKWLKTPGIEPLKTYKKSVFVSITETLSLLLLKDTFTHP